MDLPMKGFNYKQGGSGPQSEISQWSWGSRFRFTCRPHRPS